MLLDDERAQREGMARHVDWEEHCFEPPLLCANGWDALETLKTEPVDVLLTDIRMPGMDGLEVMAKARLTAPELFVVVVSGYADFHYAQEALRNGAREYLLKPVKPEEIHRVLAEFVSLRSARLDQGAAVEERGPIDAVTKLLEENLVHGATLEQLADAVHLNPSYLCTLFKKNCGETIFERLTRMQRERACMLLATTRLSIAEIAEQTGERTASNFTQWFRKQVGVTPMEYRRVTRHE